VICHGKLSRDIESLLPRLGHVISLVRAAPRSSAPRRSGLRLDVGDLWQCMASDILDGCVCRRKMH
jgi:hypothetical protein